MLAPKLIHAQLVRFGMCTPTAVNVLKPHTGVVNNVKLFLSVKEAKLSIVIMNVSACLALFGIKDHAFIHHVWEVKFGQVQNASAQLVSTSMAQCA